jgi:nucleotide-binding universal stress UspA family protein
MRPRILVPFDFSDSAARALAWAADLNQTLGGGPIQMLHAIDLRPPISVEGALNLALPAPAELEVLKERMREAARACGVAATPEVALRPSIVGDIIVDHARHHEIELIVMGTHGRTGFRRLILGNVAEHVVRHSPCPVATVPAGHR